MISQPTVFVVGAGASQPYNFPSGINLALEVIQLTKCEPSVSRLSAITGMPTKAFREFGRALSESGKNSVDAFLEHRPDFVTVGKVAIAQVLIGREFTDVLFTTNSGQWLRYLYERMNAPFDVFGANRVSFVTFNYDRNIEHFLHTALCNTYGKDPLQVANQLSSIPIVHLHGNLGPLPWQSERGRQYSPDIDARTLAVASSGIKIIHENLGVRGDKDFRRAKKLLSEADKVLILGYGFNAINTDRLGLRDVIPDQLYAATGFGLTGAEITSIKNSQRLGHLRFTQFGCAEFLRELVW